MTTTRLKGTIYGDAGELFVISHDRRLLLAKCKPKINIYEKSTQVNVLGVVGRREKQVYCAIAFCPESEIVRQIDDDFICSITDVELYFDISDEMGIIETVKLSGLTTDDLNYNGDWEFTVWLNDPIADKMLGYLNLKKHLSTGAFLSAKTERK